MGRICIALSLAFPLGTCTHPRVGVIAHDRPRCFVYPGRFPAPPQRRPPPERRGDRG